ncbi:MAG: 1-(5-phosphoribosyl)-5-[(5-phosphoribosylamino)methylideneamino]imidazole-4-carboxamide isomerase [Bacillota bacterium]
MQVIPAIDIQKGQCVRLEQGQFDRVDVYGNNPVEMAGYWAGQGAERLHVVDLDGARTGQPVNDSLINRIIEQLEIPVQIGGGLRNFSSLQRYLDRGAARVILGTAALQNHRLLQRALAAYGPERIVIALDVKQGKVAIEGWQETTGRDVDSVIEELNQLGAGIFIYTDISRDGMLTGPDLEGIRKLHDKYEIRLIASGGISSIEDLSRLDQAGIEEAIVGKALYTGRLDLNQIERLGD